jgi:hypothetical protein
MSSARPQVGDECVRAWVQRGEAEAGEALLDVEADLDEGVAAGIFGVLRCALDPGDEAVSCR